MEPLSSASQATYWYVGLSTLPPQLTSKQVDDESNPLSFSQVFQLIPENGTYYVYVSWLDYERVPR